jgi:hypothetical protein
VTWLTCVRNFRGEKYVAVTAAIHETSFHDHSTLTVSDTTVFFDPMLIYMNIPYAVDRKLTVCSLISFFFTLNVICSPSFVLMQVFWKMVLVQSSGKMGRGGLNLWGLFWYVVL